MNISPKQIKKPWIKGGVLDEIWRRQAYFRLFKLNKLFSNHNIFNFFVKNQTRVARVNCYNTKFEEFRYNGINTWSLINDILKPNPYFKK